MVKHRNLLHNLSSIGRALFGSVYDPTKQEIISWLPQYHGILLCSSIQHSSLFGASYLIASS